MKGLKVERARTSSCIDIWPFYQMAFKEGSIRGEKPSMKVQEQFYYKLLTQILPDEAHFYYLARRGRGFLGCLHAVLLPSAWDGSIAGFYVDFIQVSEHRRKMGVGQALVDQLFEDAKNMGLKSFEFVCPRDQVGYWKKKRNAIKIGNLMRVTNG